MSLDYDSMILILTAMGIINSFILIVYGVLSPKGNKFTNQLFALLVFVLSLRVTKSIVITYSINLHDIFFAASLAGFLSIGPIFMLFTNSVIEEKYRLHKKDIVHIIPSILFFIIWSSWKSLRENNIIWPVVYRSIMLYYIVYILITIERINRIPTHRIHLRRPLQIVTTFLLIIWFSYFLDTASSFPYISGAIIYSLMIYFTLALLINKGQILTFDYNEKYKKTGLDAKEGERILRSLNQCMEQDKIYRDCTISLSKLAKKIHTSTHILSQVINEYKQKTFYELLTHYRIKEAKELLVQESSHVKISDIAFDVGYNSISSFYASFKKNTGETPAQFRKHTGNEYQNP